MQISGFSNSYDLLLNYANAAASRTDDAFIRLLEGHVDFTEGWVALSMAQTQQKAVLQVIRSQSEMDKTLLDILV